MTQMKLKWI